MAWTFLVFPAQRELCQIRLIAFVKDPLALSFSPRGEGRLNYPQRIF